MYLVLLLLLDLELLLLDLVLLLLDFLVCLLLMPTALSKQEELYTEFEAVLKLAGLVVLV